MTQNKGWRPWISFNDQSESYVNGFEAGMIYQLFKSKRLSEMLNIEEISATRFNIVGPTFHGGNQYRNVGLWLVWTSRKEGR